MKKGHLELVSNKEVTAGSTLGQELSVVSQSIREAAEAARTRPTTVAHLAVRDLVGEYIAGAHPSKNRSAVLDRGSEMLDNAMVATANLEKAGLIDQDSEGVMVSWKSPENPDRKWTVAIAAKDGKCLLVEDLDDPKIGKKRMVRPSNILSDRMMYPRAFMVDSNGVRKVHLPKNEEGQPLVIDEIEDGKAVAVDLATHAGQADGLYQNWALQKLRDVAMMDPSNLEVREFKVEN